MRAIHSPQPPFHATKQPTAGYLFARCSLRSLYASQTRTPTAVCTSNGSTRPRPAYHRIRSMCAASRDSRRLRMGGLLIENKAQRSEPFR